ncbi:MAG: energy transducer TonB [Bacteroidota bacterium]|nr:energy transducer TonB [Bacteroidota bacterium]
MAKRIKFRFFYSLFLFFSYLADKSGGWKMFVKPKLILGMLIVSLGVVAQNQPRINKKTISTKKSDSTKLSIEQNSPSDPNELCYVIVEEEPLFPDGNVAAYIAKSLHYPESCYQQGIQGRVICQFVVEKDGRLTNIQVVRGVHPDLDKEAVRVISCMPKWIPGKQRNHTTRVKYTLPVNFKIKEAEVSDTTIYTVADKMPQFSDGDLATYLAKNIREYPVYQCYNGIQGRVICQFVVEKDGCITNLHVVRGIDPSLDKEAVRVILSMPKWIPAESQGKKVRVRYTLPVNFKLQ